MNKYSRILVTGAAGFIGSHFVDRLLLDPPAEAVLGYDLFTYAGRRENLELALEDKRFHLVTGDVRDTQNLRLLISAERIDTICHFAAETHVDRSILGARAFVETNVEGTYSVLEAAKAGGVKNFLHVSTDEVYGPAPEGVLFTEDAPLRPTSPYAATKAAADLLVQSFVKTHGLPAVIVRGANNFGPRQFPEKLIPFFISRALAGEDLPIYGDGQQRRDWIWVSDFCQGMLLALQKAAPGSVYNLGAENEWTNKQVAALLCEALDYPAGRLRHVSDRPGHDRRYAMDCSKAAEELGFKPRREFADAIRQTVAWYKERSAWAEQVRRESAEYFEKNYGSR